ncbi:MAG: hypothetical protein LQ346_004752 [Caloplaca aetnensis]|nr:MAG: hypothetical protein LQ346_004752 [Caloplaca aetnensis]
MPQQSASRQNPGFAAGMSQNPTPLRRMPLGNMSASNVNRSNFGGYGMSAGLKVGRQQCSRMGVAASNPGQPHSGLDNQDPTLQFSQNTRGFR